MEESKTPRLGAKPAGQDAPPTANENDMVKTSYALLFKRNGIRMHNLELLVNEVRDIIIKFDKSPDVLEDRATKMNLCSCLDVIVDTACCLGAFTNTDIEQLDVGDKYVYVYGTLQALVLQQDAVKHFTCTLKKDGSSELSVEKEIAIGMLQ